MPEIVHRITANNPQALASNPFATKVGIRSAVALTALLGLGAAGWVIALPQMSGMDMGVSTQLGSFGDFLAVWVPMMAAMMLPGAVPAVLRYARSGGGLKGVILFVGVYVAVWTAFGVAVYPVYRPHGTFIAGLVVAAAGLYELTSVKLRCRRRCLHSIRSGEFALACLGSTIGLMLAMVAIGVMNQVWMAIIAVLACAQKFLPARRRIDLAVAGTLVVLGVLILVAPTSIPGLMPSGVMPSM